MHGHSKCGLVLGKSCRRNPAEPAVVADEPGQKMRTVGRIREQNSDVSIIESERIIVLCNKNRQAGVSILRAADQSLCAKNFLDGSIEVLDAVGADPERAENAELFEIYECLGWIRCPQVGGVAGNDPLAQLLRDLGWGRRSSGAE